MLITVPLGAGIALLVLRHLLGAVLALVAMQRGMQVRLKVGLSLSFSTWVATDSRTADDSGLMQREDGTPGPYVTPGVARSARADVLCAGAARDGLQDRDAPAP